MLTRLPLRLVIPVLAVVGGAAVLQAGGAKTLPSTISAATSAATTTPTPVVSERRGPAPTSAPPATRFSG